MIYLGSADHQKLMLKRDALYPTRTCFASLHGQKSKEVRAQKRPTRACRSIDCRGDEARVFVGEVFVLAWKVVPHSSRVGGGGGCNMVGTWSSIQIKVYEI